MHAANSAPPAAALRALIPSRFSPRHASTRSTSPPLPRPSAHGRRPWFLTLAARKAQQGQWAGGGAASGGVRPRAGSPGFGSRYDRIMGDGTRAGGGASEDLWVLHEQLPGLISVRHCGRRRDGAPGEGRRGGGGRRAEQRSAGAEMFMKACHARRREKGQTKPQGIAIGE